MTGRDCSRFQEGVQASHPGRPRPRRARRDRAPGWGMLGVLGTLRGAELLLELLVGLDHALVLPARLDRLLEGALHPGLDLTTCTLGHLSTSRTEPSARTCWSPAPMGVEQFGGRPKTAGRVPSAEGRPPRARRRDARRPRDVGI